MKIQRPKYKTIRGLGGTEMTLEIKALFFCNFPPSHPWVTGGWGTLKMYVFSSPRSVGRLRSDNFQDMSVSSRFMTWDKRRNLILRYMYVRQIVSFYYLYRLVMYSNDTKDNIVDIKHLFCYLLRSLTSHASIFAKCGFYISLFAINYNKRLYLKRNAKKHDNGRSTRRVPNAVIKAIRGQKRAGGTRGVRPTRAFLPHQKHAARTLRPAIN